MREGGHNPACANKGKGNPKNQKGKKMKKIINGKKYDTDTAKIIAEWNNGYCCGDLKYCSETLYKKRTGEYFIYGYGGAMSKYSESQGNNNWTCGEEIIPVSYKAAKEWTETNANTETYESEFGEIKEDESKTIITISINADKAEAARREAAKKGISLSEYINALLE